MILIRPWTLTSRSNIEVLTCLHVLPITSAWFDISKPYFTHGSIIMRECVAFIHDPDMILIFDLKVNNIYFLASFLGHNFLFCWHSHTISGTWVYHHRIMCRIHSGPLCDLDLWPQNYIFTMNFCLGKIVFAFWHRHTKLCTWVYCTRQHVVYIHDLYMTLAFDLYVVSDDIPSEF